MWSVSVYTREKGVVGQLGLSGGGPDGVRKLTYDLLREFFSRASEGSDLVELIVSNGSLRGKYTSTNWIKKTRVPTLEGEEQHTITEFDDGHYECSCLEFKRLFESKRLGCEHILREKGK